MLRSDGRILTTHTGSLPRGRRLSELLIARHRGEPVDVAELRAAAREGVDAAIELQLRSGIDVGNNGEQPRFSYSSYVSDRMSGFGGRSQRNAFIDFELFPAWAEQFGRRYLEQLSQEDYVKSPAADAEVRYADLAPIQHEVADYRAALAAQGDGFVESFMNAASPGIVAAMLRNQYYATHEEYVFALARELRTEYEYVVEQGLVLQIDAPDIPGERGVNLRDGTLSDYLAIVESHVAALNEALANIPPDRVRMHCCWGNYPGPHVHDVELREVLPLLYRANVGALVLPFANPRHAHEIELFARYPLPDSMALVVGAIDITTEFVEHPELVAQRLVRAAEVVGDPSRILAGTDCGFGAGVGQDFVAGEIVPLKLRALRDGADLASERLFG